MVVRNRIIVEHTALRSYYPNEPPTGEVFGELRATQKNWTPENHGTRRGKESQYRWGEQGGQNKSPKTSSPLWPSVDTYHET